MLYDNENYEVIIKDGKYWVINRKTDIKEFNTELLPEALNAAYALNFRIKQFWEESNKQEDVSIAQPIISRLN
jgi:hypothetical protein